MLDSEEQFYHTPVVDELNGDLHCTANLICVIHSHSRSWARRKLIYIVGHNFGIWCQFICLLTAQLNPASPTATHLVRRGGVTSPRGQCFTAVWPILKIVVVDYAGGISMQNWSHLHVVVEQLNQLPSEENVINVPWIRPRLIFSWIRIYAMLYGCTSIYVTNSLYCE